jgi:hypothetical protein
MCSKTMPLFCKGDASWKDEERREEEWKGDEERSEDTGIHLKSLLVRVTRVFM